MVSHRKRKREANARDLSVRELELADLLEEVLDSVRWQQILGYANQFLLERYVDVPKEERDKILAAAVRSVDKDRQLHEWHERLARVKGETLHIQRSIRRAKKGMGRGEAAPRPPGANDLGESSAN